MDFDPCVNIHTKGTAPISAYIHAKLLGTVVCQVFCSQLFISRKKKGKYHKQGRNVGYHPDFYIYAKKLASH